MNEAPNQIPSAQDEEAERRPAAFWEATASDALREIWDTPENEAWDTVYQQAQGKGKLPFEHLI